MLAVLTIALVEADPIFKYSRVKPEEVGFTQYKEAVGPAVPSNGTCQVAEGITSKEALLWLRAQSPW